MHSLLCQQASVMFTKTVILQWHIYKKLNLALSVSFLAWSDFTDMHKGI